MYVSYLHKLSSQYTYTYTYIVEREGYVFTVKIRRISFFIWILLSKSHISNISTSHLFLKRVVLSDMCLDLARLFAFRPTRRHFLVFFFCSVFYQVLQISPRPFLWLTAVGGLLSVATWGTLYRQVEGSVYLNIYF